MFSCSSGRRQIIAKTEILELVSRKLAPYILLFGCYLVSFGHVSPGGGFQGGAVLASGVILFCLGLGAEKIEKLFPVKRMALAEAVAYILLLGAGTAGMIAGGAFLEDIFPRASADEMPAANFIFILNVIIGLKVGAGISLACLTLFKEE